MQVSCRDKKQSRFKGQMGRQPDDEEGKFFARIGKAVLVRGRSQVQVLSEKMAP